MIKTKTKYINREISWLRFNERVLQECEDENVPLIERLRFLGIFSNNLDEFFKVRYATVKRIFEAGKSGKSVLGGEKAKDLLEEITKFVIEQQRKSVEILKKIENELEEQDIFLLNENELTEKQGEFVRKYFIQKVSPQLMTIILNDLAEFPMLKDTAAYLAIKMVLKSDDRTKRTYEKKEKRYALIEIPKGIDRFVVLPKEGNKNYIIILDDVIRYCMDSVFPMFDYKSISSHMIKITRDAELDIDNDLSKSFIEKIYSSVEHRKISDPVRFVYDKNIETDTLDFLKDKMGIEDADSVIPGGRYHNKRDYMGFPSLGREDLMYEKIAPLPVKGLPLEGSLLEKIAEKDYLQYTPYHTFSYVLKFLREAALDPKVKTIKITVYRLANDSQVAACLSNAVKNGKQVTLQIELRARFDEQANIRYAEELQAEGVKLIFGVPGLKVHSKICMIEREENGLIKRYGFISTGNFNESTARIYTDYTLFTANEPILKELNKVFDFFETTYKINKYRHLIVSPHYTKSFFKKLIQKEINNAKEGKEAYIKIKMNSFTSYKMIDMLYKASNAGVKIQLIVRGICCLIPGIKGMSENIEAISIVDKFLEHPRLFIFCNDGDPRVFISSADFMTRNLENRVEVGCPIYDEDVKNELIDTFEISWNDNVKARVFNEAQDNAYRVNNKPKLRSQFAMYDYYRDKLGSDIPTTTE
ncbi:polyphosphate kinase 1 [Zobellia galactanivorans]|uniref:Polyphosphate kinase n=1 Tax=Zobellia galactanivorans (strain DSM 12802 / CCUG 47099 / CIP 106680 / NCIMB 13871 / Dsij) TaxID=63186 RepID=G0L9G9_ZOBGA|nr:MULTISPECIES: polyphosphate kinase 1 [Zobellia]MBU3026991.1 polyphosphate kinase 1 [Zobellia galactanivorans]MDO6810253.1 polyphosphate kinase 1 [Zobellia galactanivorans]OWW23841.1 polyphosphate kinase 1 [Zobellia sp. OII3]CAZ94569.1 Polyphosphate kinase 1 [Zobellia galactanivorans]